MRALRGGFIVIEPMEAKKMTLENEILDALFPEDKVSDWAQEAVLNGVVRTLVFSILDERPKLVRTIIEIVRKKAKSELECEPFESGVGVFADAIDRQCDRLLALIKDAGEAK